MVLCPTSCHKLLRVNPLGKGRRRRAHNERAGWSAFERTGPWCASGRSRPAFGTRLCVEARLLHRRRTLASPSPTVLRRPRADGNMMRMHGAFALLLLSLSSAAGAPHYDSTRLWTHENVNHVVGAHVGDPGTRGFKDPAQTLMPKVKGDTQRAATGATLVQSITTVGVEGWTTVKANGNPSAVQLGADIGKGVVGADTNAESWYFLAPGDKFSGDLSQAYNGQLSVTLVHAETPSGGSIKREPDVVLEASCGHSLMLYNFASKVSLPSARVACVSLPDVLKLSAYALLTLVMPRDCRVETFLSCSMRTRAGLTHELNLHQVRSVCAPAVSNVLCVGPGIRVGLAKRMCASRDAGLGLMRCCLNCRCDGLFGRAIAPRRRQGARRLLCWRRVDSPLVGYHYIRQGLVPLLHAGRHRGPLPEKAFVLLQP